MQEVLYLIYTGNFYFWILLPGREMYFLGLALSNTTGIGLAYHEPKKDNATLTGYRVLIITFIGFLLSCL